MGLSSQCGSGESWVHSCPVPGQQALVGVIILAESKVLPDAGVESSRLPELQMQDSRKGLAEGPLVGKRTSEERTKSMQGDPTQYLSPTKHARPRLFVRKPPLTRTRLLWY